MIGKPFPLTRRCFQCAHVHPVGQSCDEARRLRAARVIVDLALALGGAFIIGLVVVIVRAL